MNYRKQESLVPPDLLQVLLRVSGANSVAMARKSADFGNLRGLAGSAARGQGGRQRRAATKEASGAIG